MKNTILFGNRSLTRFTAEIFTKILQNILRIFFYCEKSKNQFYILYTTFIQNGQFLNGLNFLTGKTLQKKCNENVSIAMENNC